MRQLPSYWPGVAALLLFGSITFIAVELQYLGAYLYPNRLLWWSLPIGLFFAGILYYFLRKEIPQKIGQQVRAVVAIVFGTLMVCPWLLSWTNRQFDFSEPSRQVAILEKEEGRYSSRFGQTHQQLVADHYLLFFYLDNDLYRFRSGDAHFEGLSKGDTIQIPIKSGAWGFRWIKFD